MADIADIEVISISQKKKYRWSDLGIGIDIGIGDIDIERYRSDIDVFLNFQIFIGKILSFTDTQKKTTFFLICGVFSRLNIK